MHCLSNTERFHGITHANTAVDPGDCIGLLRKFSHCFRMLVFFPFKVVASWVQENEFSQPRSTRFPSCQDQEMCLVPPLHLCSCIIARYRDTLGRCRSPCKSDFPWERPGTQGKVSYGVYERIMEGSNTLEFGNRFGKKTIFSTIKF